MAAENQSRCSGRGRSTYWLLGLAVFMVGYLCLGAGVFMAVEGPLETHLVGELRRSVTRFLDDNSCVSDEELEKFILTIVTAANRGVSAARNVTVSEPNWSFGQSLFFASTIVTTVGYGRVTPLSDAGKVFCLLYAIVGIPLTLVMFTAIVERLMIPTSWFLKWLTSKIGHLYQTFHIRMFHLLIVVGMVLVFFYLIPSGIYAAIEPNWNYLDSFYYCVISLTTIGLGDYIPGDTIDQPHRAVYKVATTVYLLLGLMMMMLILSVLYEIPELNFGFHFYLKKEATEEERVGLRSSETAGAKYTQFDDRPAGATKNQSNDTEEQ